MKTSLLHLMIASLFLAVLVVPAQAGEPATAPTCLAALGDKWGESKTELPSQEIDGSTIRTVDEFARMTSADPEKLKMIRGGDFWGWNMAGLDLSSICFEESKLTEANLAGVLGHGTGFIDTDLSGANLQGARLSAVLFRDADLTGTRAQGADFIDGHFDGGWFKGGIAGWNLDGANLSGFTFDCGITLDDGCPVFQGGEQVSMKGVNLTGTVLHSFGLFDVDLAGARLDGTIVGPGQLPYVARADFAGEVILRGGEFDVAITASEAQQLIAANARRAKQDSQASFDCAKARTVVEKEICGEYQSALRAADRDMASLYARAVAKDRAVRKSQRAWLKKRNACARDEYSADCIRRLYSARKGELLGQLGGEKWLEPGGEAIFVSEVLPLPADFIDTPLHRKIALALLGASRTQAWVRRQEDGLYKIDGWSIGANAHTCGLNADTLYLDRETGWYSIVSDGDPAPIFRLMDDRLEIFGNGKPDYEKYAAVLDHVSCGARASFTEMRRLNVDDATMTRIKSSYVPRY
ncbi:MAG: pentapeptide repeat-containing protein [Pseudomonadota bacterium]